MVEWDHQYRQKSARRRRDALADLKVNQEIRTPAKYAFETYKSLKTSDSEMLEDLTIRDKLSLNR